MFELAVEAQRAGRGVVGSTSNILNFILSETEKAATKTGPTTIPVVLGTEAGMITAIVRKVQAKLQTLERADIAVEIIFPVSSEAVAQDDSLGIIPGVAGGEGCSTAGGCATCPYMKMNSLDNLVDLLEKINLVPTTLNKETGRQKYNAASDPLSGFLPPKRNIHLKDPTKTLMETGSTPIRYMREFMNGKVFPDSLIKDIASRHDSNDTGNGDKIEYLRNGV